MKRCHQRPEVLACPHQAHCAHVRSGVPALGPACSRQVRCARMGPSVPALDQPCPRQDWRARVGSGVPASGQARPRQDQYARVKSDVPASGQACLRQARHAHVRTCVPAFQPPPGRSRGSRELGALVKYSLDVWLDHVCLLKHRPCQFVRTFFFF